MAVKRKSKIASYCRTVESAERDVDTLERYLDHHIDTGSPVVEGHLTRIRKALQSAYVRDCRGDRYRQHDR